MRYSNISSDVSNSTLYLFSWESNCNDANSNTDMPKFYITLISRLALLGRNVIVSGFEAWFVISPNRKYIEQPKSDQLHSF